ncbi:unnamed protein product [Lymnaea stagnalis]|uniref:Alpha-2-macroglobulin receptor-associated protein n=1 Tax=Lymnaea stagnalis TaxID=6523 RepID=A0AAV2HF87_LYMST
MEHLKQILILYSILTLFLIEFSHSNKYSQTANTDINLENQDKPFRMKKTNLLWSKAQERLSSVKLAELYADLQVHDRQELHLKKMKGDNFDKDGQYEARVLASYRRIIEDFGLEDVFFGNEIPDHDQEKKSSQFQDPKLQSMWKRAEESGFTEKDLKMLREEFWHQQMRIQEYQFLHRQLNDFPDPEDNTVDLEQKKLGLSTEDVSNKKAAMKNTKKDIKDGYMKLEHLTATLSGSEPMFKDHRVLKLWALAKKTNWSEEEQNSFKEELKHFENRLSKEAFYKEQVELSSSENELKDRHQELKDKHEFMNRKVKKLHTDLKTRIDKALMHSEL